VVVGGSATLATAVTALSNNTGAAASAVAGAIMMGWIAVEFRMLPKSSWLEGFYFGAGLLMVILAVIVWF
jgi:hypothetical protein